MPKPEVIESPLLIGRPDEVLDKAAEWLRIFTDLATWSKVGKTSHPYKRRDAEEYSERQKMHLVYVSVSQDEVERVEAGLIAICKEAESCANVNEGSAGTLADEANYHFVYLVADY